MIARLCSVYSLTLVFTALNWSLVYSFVISKLCLEVSAYVYRPNDLAALAQLARISPPFSANRKAGNRKVSAHSLHHISEHLINGQGRMETKTNFHTFIHYSNFYRHPILTQLPLRLKAIFRCVYHSLEEFISLTKNCAVKILAKQKSNCHPSISTLDHLYCISSLTRHCLDNFVLCLSFRRIFA